MTGELSTIVDFVSQLAELDTDDVEPLAHPLETRNVFREDEPRPRSRPSRPCHRPAARRLLFPRAGRAGRIGRRLTTAVRTTSASLMPSSMQPDSPPSISSPPCAGAT